jgi:hypothetical protein
MQIGTLVRVYPVSMAGTCLPSWVGRIHEIYSDGMVEVSNGNNHERVVSVSEVREIAEMLPVR